MLSCFSTISTTVGGGKCTGAGKYVTEAMVDVYDTVSGAWGLLQPLNYPRGKLVGASAGPCMAFGGGSGRPVSTAAAQHGDVDIYCVS